MPAESQEVLSALESSIPETWSEADKRHMVDQVACFEKRHRTFTCNAARALTASRIAPPSSRERAAFEKALVHIQRNRLFVPAEAAVSTAADSVGKARVGRSAPQRRAGHRAGHVIDPTGADGKSWTLVTSVWAGRQLWAESHDFWDTDKVIERVMILEWRKVHAKSTQLIDYLLKHDSSYPDDKQLITPSARSEFIAGIEDVLVAHGRLFLSAFDYYSCYGASLDIFHIYQLGYCGMIEDAKLAVKGSKACDMPHMDLIFVVANREQPAASAKTGRPRPQRLADHDSKHGLTRCEFLHCLLRIAVARFILSGRSRLGSVSNAVAKLFDVIQAGARSAILHSSNRFRTQNCYTEATDIALRVHEEMLRSIFEKYSSEDGAMGGKRAESSKLLSCTEWISLGRDLSLIDDDLSVEDAKLIFSWSRMRVVDEDKAASRQKLENLSFYDFLEAIVRVAHCKALPTDNELRESGQVDAFDFLLNLKKNDREAYQSFLSAADGEWNSPPRQPIESAVQHLLMYVVRTVNERLGRLEYAVPNLNRVRLQYDELYSRRSDKESLHDGEKKVHGRAWSDAIVQQFEEALTVQLEIHGAAAKAIERYCRGALARIRRRRSNWTAIKLQCYVRGCKARIWLRKLHRAAVHVQALHKGRQTRGVMLALSVQARDHILLERSQRRAQPKFPKQTGCSAATVPVLASGGGPDPQNITFLPRVKLPFRRSFTISEPLPNLLLRAAKLRLLHSEE